jgi:hypothetical protein
MSTTGYECRTDAMGTCSQGHKDAGDAKGREKMAPKPPTKKKRCFAACAYQQHNAHKERQCLNKRESPAGRLMAANVAQMGFEHAATQRNGNTCNNCDTCRHATEHGCNYGFSVCPITDLKKRVSRIKRSRESRRMTLR